MKIADRKIGSDASPFVIAEMSGNHNQSLDRALAIVEAAAKAGAHAIKLQTYTADTITLDVSEGEFFINDENSLWKGSSLHNLYKLAHTPWEWHVPIMQRARDLGLICFSTPFDESAVEFLESLGVPAYKIASFENVHLPLIRKVAATGKPLFISTGMATLAEIDEAVRTARDAGNHDLVLLKCISTYPATPEHSNMCTIPHLRAMFGCEVGISDHTMGVGVSVAAVALGATVIEKHFTLKRADGGVDSAFSLEPEELRNLVIETERAFLSLGKVNYELTEKEKKGLQFKRSLYIVKDIRAGEVITPQHIRSIRPGNGLHTRHYEDLIGKIIKVNAKAGTPVSFSMVK